MNDEELINATLESGEGVPQIGGELDTAMETGPNPVGNVTKNPEPTPDSPPLLISEADAASRIGVGRKAVSDVRKTLPPQMYGRKNRELWLTQAGYDSVCEILQAGKDKKPPPTSDTRTYTVCSRQNDRGWHCGNPHWFRAMDHTADTVVWIWARKSALHRHGQPITARFSPERNRLEVV